MGEEDKKVTGYRSYGPLYDLRDAAYQFGWQDARQGKEEQPERELKVLRLEKQVQDHIDGLESALAGAREEVERLRERMAASWERNGGGDEG